jgi:2-polyprenyl-3-methyl-5-hydroxy-6-metoxy-1,4-benzoquinol methylase
MTFPETADIETSSDAYAARFAGPVGEWFLTRQYAIVEQLLAAHPGARILDVGGGHGQLALPLCRAGYQLTVLGSDPVCAQRLQQPIDSGHMEFIVGNIIELPFPDHAFDIALCFRLLPHCAQWEKLIAELCRAARHSVIVDYPTHQSLNCLTRWLFGAKKKIEGNTRPYTLFSHGEINRSFAQHGRTRAAFHPQFFLPMVLHRAMKKPRLSAALERLCAASGLTRLWGSPVIAAF